MQMNECCSYAFPVDIHHDRYYGWKDVCNECGFAPKVTVH